MLIVCRVLLSGTSFLIKKLIIIKILITETNTETHIFIPHIRESKLCLMITESRIVCAVAIMIKIDVIVLEQVGQPDTFQRSRFPSIINSGSITFS